MCESDVGPVGTVGTAVDKIASKGEGARDDAYTYTHQPLVCEGQVCRVRRVCWSGSNWLVPAVDHARVVQWAQEVRMGHATRAMLQDAACHEHEH